MGEAVLKGDDTEAYETRGTSKERQELEVRITRIKRKGCWSVIMGNGLFVERILLLLRKFYYLKDSLDEHFTLTSWCLCTRAM